MKHRFSPNPRHRGKNAAAARALGAKRQKVGTQINIERFINKAQVAEQVTAYQPTNTFPDFSFDARLAKNLERRGYVHPTAIQDQAMKPVIAGHDLIGLANTGTGKTATFLLPIIDRILSGNREESLIIVPTRELALQINDECAAFTQGLSIKTAVCIGGQSMYKQIAQLKKGPQIVIGTPGRLKDLIVRRNLNVSRSHVLVLDEVDRMLDMGFVRLRSLLEYCKDIKKRILWLVINKKL